jgi:hypothetical protein
MPCSGEITEPVGLTAALPPPAVSGSVVPSAPITAIDEVCELSGRTEPESFSRTVPSSEFCWAKETCAGIAASVDSLPVGWLLKKPKRNISNRIRVTAWSMVAVLT